MENGPRLSIDFDKLTNRQLYHVFIEAVKVRDIECVKECIKRDGLTIEIDCKTIATHLAFINDVASCEFLLKFDNNLTRNFISGALLGDHEEFLKGYLTKHNIRADIKWCAIAAITASKIEILKKYWYPDQLNDFIKLSTRCIAPQNLRVFLATCYSQDTTASLIKHYPKEAIFIMVARDEKEMLFNFFKIQGTDEIYKAALKEAIRLRRTALEETILPMIEDIDLSSMVRPAIVSSDLSKVEFYFNKYKRFINSQDIKNFHLLAVMKGEIFIANFLAAQLSKEEKLNYKELANIAVDNNFKYAGRYFLMRHIQSIQHSPEKKISTNMKKSTNEEQPIQPAASLQNTEQPANKLKNIIQNNVASILDIQNQNRYQDKFKDVKIDSDDLNFILEQMLIFLEKQQFVNLIHLKGQIFISKDEPAIQIFKEITIGHAWIDRSCFSKDRAKLVTISKSTTVSLAKFYEFYNLLCNSLKALKNEPPVAPSPTPYRNEAEQTPETPTNKAESAPEIPAKKEELAHPSKEKQKKMDSYHVPKQPKRQQHNATHRNQQARNQPSSSNPGPRTKPSRQEQPKKQENKNEQKNPEQSKYFQPLPPKGPSEFLPLRNSNLDLDVLQRPNDSVSNKMQLTKSVQQSIHFEPLNQVMLHFRETQQALNMDTNGLMIHDLAILDLLLKINRDLDDEEFSTTFIHGIHHYLMHKSPTFSNIISFVEECFNFGSKQVINPLIRGSHTFVRSIQNINGLKTEPVDRLKLIQDLFKLQPLCYQLCQSSNTNFARVGRHALSGIIMVIGEQVQQLNGTDIDKKLAELPVYKILNEYRLYRNVRHGTDYTKQVNNITFNLVRDDWNKQLDNIIANFNQYFCNEYVAMLDSFELIEVSEMQEKTNTMRI